MAEIIVVNPKTGERVRITDDGNVISDDGIIKRSTNAKEAIRWLVKNRKDIEIEKDNEITS